MSRGDDRNDRAPNAQRIEELTREVETLREGIASRDARIVELSAELDAHKAVLDAPSPVGDEVWVLRTKLELNGRVHPKGSELPFDPHNPPAGCSGFIEGKHYERARVIVREARAAS